MSLLVVMSFHGLQGLLLFGWPDNTSFDFNSKQSDLVMMIFLLKGLCLVTVNKPIIYIIYIISYSCPSFSAQILVHVGGLGFRIQGFRYTGEAFKNPAPPISVDCL